ncbi:MAG: hypothetical protein Q7I93_02250 [Syntrophales bacterium]|nr:hypothetical protein [Syntrophales bacterium]
MPSGTEMKVLKGLKKKGGETNLFGVAKEIGLSTDYARIVCRALGMADYLDMLSTGKVKLTPKGWKAVGGRDEETSRDESAEAQKKKPESRQEKFEHWKSS